MKLQMEQKSIIPQTTLAFEGFLLGLQVISFAFQDFPSLIFLDILEVLIGMKWKQI